MVLFDEFCNWAIAKEMKMGLDEDDAVELKSQKLYRIKKSGVPAKVPYKPSSQTPSSASSLNPKKSRPQDFKDAWGSSPGSASSSLHGASGKASSAAHVSASLAQASSVSSGITRALLIGINYIGTNAALRFCATPRCTCFHFTQWACIPDHYGVVVRVSVGASTT
jgi:hypothetical protein